MTGKKIKILYLHSSADQYGADRSLLRLIKYLPLNTFSHCVVLPYNGPLVKEIKSNGGTVFIKKLGVLRRQFFTIKGIIQQLWHMVRGIFFLKKIIKQHNIDLIHSNTTGIFIGGITAHLSSIPHVQHVREIIIHPKIIWQLTALNLFLFSKCIICVSTPVVEHLSVAIKGIRKKVKVVHNGIDCEKFSRQKYREIFRKELEVSDEKVIIGMIGRVSAWKGQDFFLNCVKLYLERNKNKKSSPLFIMIGSPFQGQEWRMEKLYNDIKEDNLQEYICVFEFREDIPSILAGFDIFTLPSTLPDPLPTIVLEAMASSLPVVSNNFGGVIEMVEQNVTGILIPPNDVDELAKAWEKLIRDNKLREKMGKNARKRLESNFTVQKYIDNMEKVFLKVAV